MHVCICIRREITHECTLAYTLFPQTPSHYVCTIRELTLVQKKLPRKGVKVLGGKVLLWITSLLQ